MAATEVRTMGYMPTTEHGGVSLPGTIDSIYELNLSHRSGSRILLRVADFLAQNYPMLYHHTRKLPWEVLLGNCPSLAVRASFRNSRLRNRSHIADAVSDGISARLEKYGMTIGSEHTAAMSVHARVFRDRCTISLDTSGEHLHRRGYRPEAFHAPLRETTAAGVLLAARAGNYNVIVDPFCGSGTIPIEADLLVRNCAPNMKRPFAIECSALHSAGTLAEAKRRLTARCAGREVSRQVLGFDIDEEAVEISRRCAARADTRISTFDIADARRIDFRALLEKGERGLVATNLPYGVRIGNSSEAASLARQFGAQLASRAKGWDFAIVTAEGSSAIRGLLSVQSAVPFNNGGVRAEALFGTVKS